MSAPTNVKTLRTFLGFVTYLAKFLPNFSTVVAPLRLLLCKKTELIWGAEQQRAFENVKEMCLCPSVLAKYDPSRETRVATDASQVGLGCCLLQKYESQWRPVFYASKALSETEKRYSTIEKEALGVVWACEKFSNHLIGIQFSIVTDHSPLIQCFTTKQLDEISPRLQRIRIRLMKYDFQISHVAGIRNILPDMLSRSPQVSRATVNELKLTQDIQAFVAQSVKSLPIADEKLNLLKAELQNDSLCRVVMEYCLTEWPQPKYITTDLKPYYNVRNKLSLHNNLLMYESRLVIPKSMQYDLLEKLHAGHQGIVKCRASARQSVWFPGLSSRLQQLIQRCKICNKHSVQNREPLIVTDKPMGPWQKIGTDLFDYNGKVYIVVIDYFSNWIESCQLPDATAKSVIAYMNNLVSRYGIFYEIRSDNGPCYSAHKLKDFCNRLSARHITSSPHYAQSNGMSEAGVKIVKGLMKKNNDDVLKATFTHNSTPMASGYSPAQLFLGRKLNTEVPTHPSELVPIWPALDIYRKKTVKNSDKQKHWFDNRHRARKLPLLQLGDHVYVNEGKSKFPGIIVEKLDQPRSYLVKTKKGLLRRNRWMLIKPACQPVFEEIDIENDDLFENITYDNMHINNNLNTSTPVHEEVIVQQGRGVRQSNRVNRGVPPPRLGVYT